MYWSGPYQICSTWDDTREQVNMMFADTLVPIWHQGICNNHAEQIHLASAQYISGDYPNELWPKNDPSEAAKASSRPLPEQPHMTEPYGHQYGWIHTRTYVENLQ